MMRRTHQGHPLRLPVVRATSTPQGTPQVEDKPEQSALWSARREHDYTYGLSRSALRPIVLDEAYSLLSVVQNGGVSRNESQWRGMRAESA